jgi:hypothetical protein
VINDLETARRVAKQGVWAALFVSIVTAVLAAVAAFGSSLAGIQPIAFSDAAMFAVLSIGIGKMSRVAATAALVLFLIEKPLMFRDGQRPGGVFVAMFITFVFLNTVRATFRFRQLLAVTPDATGPEPIVPT